MLALWFFGIASLGSAGSVQKPFNRPVSSTGAAWIRGASLLNSGGLGEKIKRMYQHVSARTYSEHHTAVTILSWSKLRWQILGV